MEVRKAFYDLLGAQDELRIHDEHETIARQSIEAARIRYTVGKVPQQDLLKAQLELTRQSLAKKAYTPDFTVSARYMLMPPTSAMRNTYMVEGSMTPPWRSECSSIRPSSWWGMATGI
jgi:outer membrane efflux protein